MFRTWFRRLFLGLCEMTAMLEPGLALEWDGGDVHLQKMDINSPN